MLEYILIHSPGPPSLIHALCSHFTSYCFTLLSFLFRIPMAFVRRCHVLGYSFLIEAHSVLHTTRRCIILIGVVLLPASMKSAHRDDFLLKLHRFRFQTSRIPRPVKYQNSRQFVLGAASRVVNSNKVIEVLTNASSSPKKSQCRRQRTKQVRFCQLVFVLSILGLATDFRRCDFVRGTTNEPRSREAAPFFVPRLRLRFSAAFVREKLK